MINFGNPPSYFDQLLINFRSWLVRNYQALLISGTNIKTINGSSVLGSGDLIVSAAGFTLVDNHTGGTTSITGVTTETILYSKRLPAGSNGANFFKGTVNGSLTMQFFIKMSVIAGANDNQYRIYFNTVNNLTGSPVRIATTPLIGRDSNEFYSIKRTFSNTSTYIDLFNPIQETLNDEFDPANLISIPGLFSTVSTNTGHTGDFFILVTVAPNNAGNTAILKSATMKLYA
jgi:hypothetical protein